MLVPINLTGGYYKHQSLPLSAQQTVNLWPQAQKNENAFSKYILRHFYGQKAFATQTGGVDRGMFVHKGVLYKVTGTTLYTVSSTGAHTSRGTISGSSRCIFAPINDDVVIVTNGSAYLYDVSGPSLTAISDPDLESPNSAAHMNSQIIYDGDGNRFGVSDVGDATSINGLNYASAESSADELVRVYSFGQTVYMMGEETIELWWNSGQGNPPFDRIEGGILNIGLAALHSVADDKNFIFFLGSDRQVYSLRGSASSVLKPVSTPEMAKEIQGFDEVSDAIGFCMRLESQDFYVLTFPTEQRTFVLPVGGEWFEWKSDGEDRNRANGYAYVFGKHLVSDYRNGNIYELDSETYDETGDTISRLRDSAPIHGGLFDLPGVKFEMNRFEIFLETGVGLASGQGSDPVVMLSYSDDGGKTFSTERWGKIGTSGEFQKVVEWQNLGTFSTRIMRIRISDPVPFFLYSAKIEIEPLI